MHEWDSAAPVALALACGLHASRLNGSALRYNQPDPILPDLVVCRPELAGDVLERGARALRAPRRLTYDGHYGLITPAAERAPRAARAVYFDRAASAADVVKAVHAARPRHAHARADRPRRSPAPLRPALQRLVVHGAQVPQDLVLVPVTADRPISL